MEIGKFYIKNNKTKNIDEVIIFNNNIKVKQHTLFNHIKLKLRDIYFLLFKKIKTNNVELETTKCIIGMVDLYNKNSDDKNIKINDLMNLNKSKRNNIRKNKKNKINNNYIG